MTIARSNRFVSAAIGMALAAIGSVGTATAQEAISTSLISDAFIAEMRDWLQKPVVQISIEAQNSRYKDVQQADIDALDKRWREEREQETQPLVAAVLSSPLSNYLTQIQAMSGGLYTEIFVVDSKGMNVGQSSVTSDYWQGDEAKFQKTFPIGADAVFIDEPELNEDTKTWRAQVNMTVVDAANKPIGAITVEVNLTELARRQAS